MVRGLERGQKERENPESVLSIGAATPTPKSADAFSAMVAVRRAELTCAGYKSALSVLNAISNRSSVPAEIPPFNSCACSAR